MKARRLLHILEARNVKLWAEGDKLKWDAPKGLITEEIKARMAAQKTELLALLQGKATDDQRAKNRFKKIHILSEHRKKTKPRTASEETSKVTLDNVILGDCLEKLKTIPDESVDHLATKKGKVVVLKPIAYEEMRMEA